MPLQGRGLLFPDLKEGESIEKQKIRSHHPDSDLSPPYNLYDRPDYWWTCDLIL